MSGGLHDILEASKPAAAVAAGGTVLPRRCIATRRRQHRNGMIRFVLGPDNRVVPDLVEKLPGRGIWVSAERQALEKSVAKNLFAKAVRGQAVVPDNLIERVTELLRQRCLQWIGQARGSGELRVGYYQVREALAQGQVAFLLEAADAAENGRAKMLGQAGDLPVISCFTRAELGQAVGRAQAVHLAVCPGKLGEHLMADARRYEGVLGLNTPQTVGEQ